MVINSPLFQRLKSVKFPSKFPTRLEELLPPAAVSKVLDLLSQPALSNAVRETMQKVGLKEGNPVSQVQDAWRQARGWFDSVVHRVLNQVESSPAAINATGELFDTRWPGAPMDTVAAQALAAAAINFQDQVKLEAFATRVAIEATGGAAATFACSPTACLSLLATCPAFGGGLVLARTDILRIPGSADIRAVLASGKNRVFDVGAVNGASASDWSEAITPERTVLLVSPNSLDSSDARQQRATAIAAARKTRSRIIECQFDATLDSELSEKFGFPHIPATLSGDVDLVIAPLDGLMAGPAGALIAGNELLVAALRESAVLQGVAMHGPALAGAAAAIGPAQLNSHAGTENQLLERSRPSSTQMLLTNTDNLKDRARRIAIQLNNTPWVLLAEGYAREGRLGPSPWNRYRLASHAVAITPRHLSIDEMHRDLATGKLGPAIWSKAEEGRLLLDLRYVDPADDHKIVEALLDKGDSNIDDNK